MSTSLNAAGLKPEQSKALPERSILPHEEPIIKSIKEMYSCNPTEQAFEVYAKDAVFHDPVGIANGVPSIRNQFAALKQLFDHADIPKFRVLETPTSLPSGTILIDQDVAYFRSSADSQKSPTKVMNSLLTLKLNDSNLIVSHQEEWNHTKTTTGDDGFLGMLNEERKKLTAKLTDVFAGGRVDLPEKSQGTKKN